MGLTMIRHLRSFLALLLLCSSAHAQFVPDYLIHPSSVCSASQVVTYPTVGSPATCVGISALSPLTTKGDIFVFGSANDRLPIGTNNHVLTPDSGQSLGLKWQSLSAQLDAVFGSTQGMILEREGSAWAALAAGSSTNYVLKSGGAGANNSWSYAPGLAFLGSSTLGSPATVLTVSGLNLSNDGLYYFNFTTGNVSASTAALSFYVHGDTTATNYYTSRAVTGAAAWTVAGAANDAIFGSLTASSDGSYWGFLWRDFNGLTRIFIFGNQKATTNHNLQFAALYWVTNTNPTSITI